MVDTVDLQHNSKSQAEEIRDKFDVIYTTIEAIGDLQKKHLLPLQQEKTKLWRELKKDVDITRKVLEVEYRRYAMEREALEMEDTVAGAKILDDMKTTFSALEKGESVNFVEALENESADQVAAE